jgi:hypothetical protein
LPDPSPTTCGTGVTVYDGSFPANWKTTRSADACCPVRIEVRYDPGVAHALAGAGDPPPAPAEAPPGAAPGVPVAPFDDPPPDEAPPDDALPDDAPPGALADEPPAAPAPACRDPPQPLISTAAVAATTARATGTPRRGGTAGAARILLLSPMAITPTLTTARAFNAAAPLALGT